MSDIFRKFVASQLKQLSTTQVILARDQINATLSRYRLQDLSYGNATFSFQTPFNSSDSNMTVNTVPTPLPSEDSILSTTEHQDNSYYQNSHNKINFDLS